jgi:plastocyanin
MKTAMCSLFIFSIVLSIIEIQGSFAKASGAEKTSAPASQPAGVSVKIENFTFEPRELEIAVGTTVTWQNADDVPHTATSKDDPQAFDSGALDTDDKFSFTFSKPGKYAYYCKVHPHMTGVVVVK